MTSSDISHSAGGESVDQGRTASGRPSASKLLGTLRRGVTSGGFAGLGGGLMVLRGFRAFRRGRRVRGGVRVLAGVLLLAMAGRRRRSASGQGGPGTGVDQQDVVDTSPDVEHVDEAGLDEEEHASGDAAREVAESSVDVEDVSDGADAEATGDQSADAETEGQVDFEAEAESPQEVIGEGTFDARRGVPVPEPAFDEGFLELESEAFWGIREHDDAVFVSHRRAVFEDGGGIEYVTSSEVDDQQLLSVPEAVLNHWEGVDDAEPMTDADELVFATTEDLRWVDVLWIVPEHRADEFSEL